MLRSAASCQYLDETKKTKGGTLLSPKWNELKTKPLLCIIYSPCVRQWINSKYIIRTNVNCIIIIIWYYWGMINRSHDNGIIFNCHTVDIECIEPFINVSFHMRGLFISGNICLVYSIQFVCGIAPTNGENRNQLPAWASSYS